MNQGLNGSSVTSVTFDVTFCDEREPGSGNGRLSTPQLPSSSIPLPLRPSSRRPLDGPETTSH